MAIAAAAAPLLEAQTPAMAPAPVTPVAEGPPVPASMILPPADAAQAVGAPPVAAPTAIGAPAALQAQAQANAAPPVSAAPLPPELQGLADATAQQQQAAQAEGDAKAQEDDARAQAEADARVERESQAAEAEEMRQTHARALQDADNQTQAALVAARDRRIPDFWEGNEGGKTQAALWAALGGFAQGLLKSSSNGAMDIIQGNVDSYYRKQKEQTDNLYKFAEASGRMTDDLRLRQAQELAELQVQHGATNLAIADRIAEIAAHSQGRVDQAAAQKLQADLAEQGQKNILAGRETLARIGLQGAQAQRQIAKAKGGSGGGGGGGATGAIGLTKAIEEGATNPDGTRRELTQSEMQTAAAANHVKLNGKPSETTLASILANGTKFKKDIASITKTETAPNKEVAAFVQKQLAGDKELAEETKANAEVRGALGLLKPDANGLVNGVAFQQAVDKTVKAATGLGARKSSVDIFKGSLGGLFDKAERFIQNQETGQYTAHDTQVLRDALNKQLAISAENAAGIRARHRGAFETNPITKGHADVYDSMLDEKLGKSAPAVPAGARLGTKDGKRGYMLNGTFTAL